MRVILTILSICTFILALFYWRSIGYSAWESYFTLLLFLSLSGNLILYHYWRITANRQSVRSVSDNGKEQQLDSDTPFVKEVFDGVEKSQRKELLYPGLTFRMRYPELNDIKIIPIGRSRGVIRTHSSEIENNHTILELSHTAENGRMLGLFAGANALIQQPGKRRFERLSDRIEIDIDKNPPVAENPLRLRLGNSLNEKNNFTGGYFEFHLFHRLDQKSGERFAVRIYKIFPGYDTAEFRSGHSCPMLEF